jgi:hypothetical protein
LSSLALDLGVNAEPFHWNEERRAVLRSEVDAAMFHVYGINKGDVSFIMDTFPIVRRKDEAKHGYYKTRDMIVSTFDEMQRAISSGTPYISSLKPCAANGWIPEAPVFSIPGTVQSVPSGS